MRWHSQHWYLVRPPVLRYLTILAVLTKCHFSGGNSPDWLSGGFRFEPWPRHRLLELRFPKANTCTTIASFHIHSDSLSPVAAPFDVLKFTLRASYNTLTFILRRYGLDLRHWNRAFTLQAANSGPEHRDQGCGTELSHLRGQMEAWRRENTL
jgi:hypothetical protein